MIIFDILAGFACAFMSVNQFMAGSSFFTWMFGGMAFICFVGAAHEKGMM